MLLVIATHQRGTPGSRHDPPSRLSIYHEEVVEVVVEVAFVEVLLAFVDVDVALVVVPLEVESGETVHELVPSAVAHNSAYPFA